MSLTMPNYPNDAIYNGATRFGPWTRRNNHAAARAASLYLISTYRVWCAKGLVPAATVRKMLAEHKAIYSRLRQG